MSFYRIGLLKIFLLPVFFCLAFNSLIPLAFKNEVSKLHHKKTIESKQTEFLSLLEIIAPEEDLEDEQETLSDLIFHSFFLSFISQFHFVFEDRIHLVFSSHCLLYKRAQLFISIRNLRI